MAEEYPNFAKLTEFVSPDGVAWRRRGRDVLEGAALNRRLRQPRVRVLHHYLGVLTDVAPTARSEFWAEAERKMADSDHAAFRGAEFRDGAGNLLLVVDEWC